MIQHFAAARLHTAMDREARHIVIGKMLRAYVTHVAGYGEAGTKRHWDESVKLCASGGS